MEQVSLSHLAHFIDTVHSKMWCCVILSISLKMEKLNDYMQILIILIVQIKTHHSHYLQKRLCILSVNVAVLVK